jgi:hypothetical protein
MAQERAAVREPWDRLLSAEKIEGVGSEKRAETNTFYRFDKNDTVCIWRTQPRVTISEIRGYFKTVTDGGNGIFQF